MNIIPIVCKTNLDLEHEIWPKELPFVPRKGDYIKSGVLRNGQNLTLKVATVTIKPTFTANDLVMGWIVELELSPGPEFYSIAEFENWYRKFLGRITIEEYQARYAQLQKDKV